MADSKNQPSHPVKDWVIRALQQTKDHARAIEESVSESIGLARKEAHRVPASALPMRDIIRSAIDGAVEAGADMADVARGILAGILRDGREYATAAQATFEDASRTILQHTEEIGADVKAATRGILAGAIRNATKAGRRARSRLSHAADHLSRAARELGTAAAETLDGTTKRKRSAS